jgi:hypothetical protein
MRQVLIIALATAASAMAAGTGAAADIGLTGGGWSETIDAADLFAGAGTDIRSPIESGSSEFRVDVSNTGGASWTVRLRRSDLSWPSGVALAARRTTDGSGPGSISGGASYQSVTALEQALFSGSGDRSGIGIQLKLEGLSVQHAPALYETTLTYSIE